MYVMPKKINPALRDWAILLLRARNAECEVEGSFSRNGEERCAGVRLNRVSCRAPDNRQVDLNRETGVRNGDVPDHV